MTMADRTALSAMGIGARDLGAALDAGTGLATLGNNPGLGLQVRREASMRPGSVNAETRTVELTFTTEAPVERFGLRPDDSLGRWVEELSLDAKAVDLSRLTSGAAPLLDTHSNWSLADVIGVVEEARLDGKVGVARVRFSERAEVEPIWRDVQAGIIRNVSVGYRVQEWQSMPGQGEVPRFRAVRWTPYEISLVPIPADAGARTRAAGGTPSSNRAETSAADEERAMPEKALDPAADGAATKTPPPVDVAAARRAAVAEERKRSAAIEHFRSKLGDDWAKPFLAEDSEATVEQIRSSALDALMAEEAKAPTSSVRAEMVEDGRDRFVRGASDWLMQRAGSVRYGLGEQRPEPGEFRGMSLLDLARHSLELSGVSVRGLDRSRIAGLALTHRSNINQGTGDFAILLANVMHKVMLGAYDLFPTTWSSWCRTGTVADFRASNRYRLGSIANLETVAQFAEVPFKPIPDGEIQSITASTKGIRVGISRQALINDDMNAFNQIPVQLGQAAQRSIEAAAYGLLAENAGLGPTMGDALAFFDAGHNNVGSGAAYSVTSIDADVSVMQVQTGPNGEKIALNPTIVLVPVSLRGTARQINTQQTDPTSSKSSTTTNIVAGQFNSVVASPYLTGTRRYLFADPSIAAAFEVAFLDGMAQPQLEEQPGWSTLGVEWRVIHDWGAAAMDYRAGVTNAGTSG